MPPIPLTHAVLQYTRSALGPLRPSLEKVDSTFVCTIHPGMCRDSCVPLKEKVFLGPFGDFFRGVTKRTLKYGRVRLKSAEPVTLYALIRITYRTESSTAPLNGNGQRELPSEAKKIRRRYATSDVRAARVEIQIVRRAMPSPEKARSERSASSDFLRIMYKGSAR